MSIDSDNASDAPSDEGDSRLAAFEHHRRLLFSIAYRMLGSVADAEDTLQEAFIRWQQASQADIRSPKAFLVTIVSRLCLTQLESARVRRETYIGEWLPEPLVTDTRRNAADILYVEQSVSMALMLLLERLTPVERAVFLLREIFDYTHAEIAATLGLSEANCRQLFRRARQHVGSRHPRFIATAREHVDLIMRFYQAAASGDMDRLVALLSSDVVLHTDGGGKAPALPIPIEGPDKVARAAVHGLRRLTSLHVLMRIVQVNGEPGIVSYLNGQPQSVFTVEAMGGRVQAIYIVTNPDKLSHLPPPPS
jgi:RNA polymerase sigma-70 factor, ECF subfamily